jgi:hypothetical protein
MDEQEEYEHNCSETDCTNCHRTGVLPLDDEWLDVDLCARCFLTLHAASASRAEIRMAARYAELDSTDDEGTDDERAREEAASDPAGPGGPLQAVLACKDVGLLSQQDVDFAALQYSAGDDEDEISWEACGALLAHNDDYDTFVAFRRAMAAGLEVQGLDGVVMRVEAITFEQTHAYKNGGFCGAGFAFSPGKRKRVGIGRLMPSL